MKATSGRLECESCERWIPMGDPVEYEKVGWPKCCGKTMLWRESGTSAYFTAMRHRGNWRGSGFDGAPEALERTKDAES